MTLIVFARFFYFAITNDTILHIIYIHESGDGYYESSFHLFACGMRAIAILRLILLSRPGCRSFALLNSKDSFRYWTQKWVVCHHYILKFKLSLFNRYMKFKKSYP
jgi:hypothetical protein